MFRIHREPTYNLGEADREECDLPLTPTVSASALPSKHITLVADALYTLKDSNIFHVSGSLFRMIMALYELHDAHVDTTLIWPEMWSSSKWLNQLFVPLLTSEFNVKIEYRATRERFCVPGISARLLERVPYSPEPTLLIRPMLERACKLSLYDTSSPPMTDVLILNRPDYLARKRNIENPEDLEAVIRSLGATVRTVLVPDTPCEQVNTTPSS